MGANTRVDTTDYPCPCGNGTVSVTQWDEERMYGGGVWQTKGVVNCQSCLLAYEGKDGKLEYVLTRRGDTSQPLDRNFERHIYPSRDGR